jgi:ribosomal protein L11 methyltransferase
MECFHEALNTAGVIADELGEDLHLVWPVNHTGLAVNRDVFVQPFASSAMAEKYYPVHIYIQTENAFGDGSHPTTRICMRFLYDLIARLDEDSAKALTLIDVGTGTGVLSILAARLGVTRIDAMELHEKAVETARQNFRLNGCDRIHAFQADISRFTTSLRYDIVLANMVSDVIIPNIGAIASLAATPGTLIVSGISDARAEEAAASFVSSGLTLRDRAKEDGWNGYLLETRG